MSPWLNPVPTDEEWVWERRVGPRSPAELLIEKRMREDLPYGIWRCVGGREVLFNRFYRAIWQRFPVEVADREEWVRQKTGIRHFYDDVPPWRSRKVAAALDRVLGEFLAGRRIG
jgi:hypothetical protein